MHVTELAVVIWFSVTVCHASACKPRPRPVEDAVPSVTAETMNPKEAVKSCGSPLVRKEWRTLSSAEKHQYIAAVKCLQKRPPRLQERYNGSRSRYDDFVASHIMQTTSVHFSGLFHPFVNAGLEVLWHRIMVAQYEAELRSECSYNGSQPYWDWTLDAESEEAWVNSPLFSAVDGFGGNGPFIDSSDDPDVQVKIPGKTGGGCVQDGPFTEDQYVVAMGRGADTRPNPRCLRRDFAPAFAVSKCNRSEVEWPQSAETFADFDERVQGDVAIAGMTYHPGAHFGVGGELGDLGDQWGSPGDPLFYVHHANVDRQWAKWQAKDPKKRTKDIAGPIIQFAEPYHFFDDAPETSKQVTLNTPMDFSGLLPTNRSVEDAMDTKGGYLCYTYDTI